MKAVETEVVIEGSGEKYAAWTFDGQVPGPVVRVTEGDTVTVSVWRNPEAGGPPEDPGNGNGNGNGNTDEEETE